MDEFKQEMHTTEVDFNGSWLDLVLFRWEIKDIERREKSGKAKL